jgi:hypothetical protein
MQDHLSLQGSGALVETCNAGRQPMRAVPRATDVQIASYGTMAHAISQILAYSFQPNDFVFHSESHMLTLNPYGREFESRPAIHPGCSDGATFRIQTYFRCAKHSNVHVECMERQVKA